MATGTASYIPSLSSSSSSSSSPNPQWTYDVFLSFRGEDTRRRFTDHLYAALNQKGIFTFWDDKELERGKAIAPELFKAIEESRYVIVILSQNYADSTWCLDELAKTMECMKVMEQTVVPVFYDVDPSEVRKQTGRIRIAFSKHEEASKDNTNVQRWRAALNELANLSGWHLQDGYESKVIQDIVEKISTELNQKISSVPRDLVAMDSHMNEMLSYLHIGLHDVRIVGVWGMGGIGKTTIARAVSERIRAQFDGNSFIANVREAIEKQGAVHLQEQLLSDLLKSSVNIQNREMGKNLIRHRLCTKRVLVVLDDVDQLEQLEALCGHSWFGSGSRIIVTSRDEHLLSTFGVDEIYKVKALTDVEALQLFSWKAFKKDQVGEDFLELSKNAVNYACGLPLALKVLGSFLFGRNKKEWSSALDRLKENPNRKIIDVLKVSFDGLEEVEKKIFLDIACFFNGESKYHVTRILESGDFYPDIGIKVLIEKSLVTVALGKLGMHDLIRELGWEIVRQECREEPGKRSRLWLAKDIIHVLVNNEGTSTVESIFLDVPKEEEVQLNVDPFSKMCKLRLLKIRNVHFSGYLNYLSNELQLLEWPGCPLNALPSNFQSNKLVELNMDSSRIKQPWRGNKCWSALQLINLSHSQYLVSTPNFTEVPNLETLVLEGCTRLVEVHPSIGVLKKLILLNMRNCTSVVSLPPFVSLESLKTLILSACSRLKKFPEIEGDMKSLLELHIDGTAIEELPPSIERLMGLTLLNLGDCKNLSHLPSTIHYLTSLKTLILTGCSELDDIPENLNCVECLEELDISGTAIRESSFIVGMKNLKSLSFQGCKDIPSKSWHSFFNCWWWRRKSHVPKNLLLPTSFSGLTSLTYLNLSDCNLMEGAIFLDDLGSLLSLKDLNLSNNSFLRLPDSISQLSKLETLKLSNCKRLQLLPKLPLSVRHVNAEDCTSLRDFPNQFKVWTSDVSGMTTVNSLISTKNQGSTTSVPPREVLRRNYTVITASPGMMSVSIPSEHQECKPSVDHLLLPIQVLQKDFQLMDYRSYGMTSLCHQNEIPEWFRNIFRGNFIEVQVPPNLKDDKKWMGVAAICLVKGNPAFLDTGSDSQTYNYFCQCTVGTTEFQLKPFHLDLDGLSFIRSKSHVLCFFYTPCQGFPEMLNKSNVVGVSFKTNSPCMEVQKCAIRLVYEQDVAGFVQTFLQFYERTGITRQLHGEKLQIIHANDYNPNEVDRATFESGWLNRVDNILRWEKYITPFSEEGSIILLRRNIESVLPRYLQVLNHDFESYNFSVSGIPAWFTTTKVGSLVSIQLPQSLHRSKKWMGFALTASLTLDHQYLARTDDRSVNCRLQVEDGDMDMTQSLGPGIYDKHQLLVYYLPRAFLPELFTTSTKIWISFSANSRVAKVQICGFRILYHQDLQGFVQTITNCILRTPPHHFECHNRKVVQEWIRLIKLRNGEVQKKILRRALSIDYRNKDWRVEQFSKNFCGIKIPKWFMHLNKDNRAEIELPQNLFDDSNWMGIAVCASASIHEHPTIILDTPNSEFTRQLVCHLETRPDGNCLCFTVGSGKATWLRACDFIWFIYMPRDRFSDSLNQCNRVRTMVGSNCPDLAVHDCALRLVFKEDVEELIQTLTLCKSSAKCRGEQENHAHQNM